MAQLIAAQPIEPRPRTCAGGGSGSPPHLPRYFHGDEGPDPCDGPLADFQGQTFWQEVDIDSQLEDQSYSGKFKLSSETEVSVYLTVDKVTVAIVPQNSPLGCVIEIDFPHKAEDKNALLKQLGEIFSELKGISSEQWKSYNEQQAFQLYKKLVEEFNGSVRFVGQAANTQICSDQNNYHHSDFCSLNLIIAEKLAYILRGETPIVFFNAETSEASYFNKLTILIKEGRAVLFFENKLGGGASVILEAPNEANHFNFCGQANLLFQLFKLDPAKLECVLASSVDVKFVNMPHPHDEEACCRYLYLARIIEKFFENRGKNLAAGLVDRDRFTWEQRGGTIILNDYKVPMLVEVGVGGDGKNFIGVKDGRGSTVHELPSDIMPPIDLLTQKDPSQLLCWLEKNLGWKKILHKRLQTCFAKARKACLWLLGKEI